MLVLFPGFCSPGHEKKSRQRWLPRTAIGSLKLDVKHPERNVDKLHVGGLYIVKEASRLEPKRFEPLVELLLHAVLLEDEVGEVDLDGKVKGGWKGNEKTQAKDQ